MSAPTSHAGTKALRATDTGAVPSEAKLDHNRSAASFAYKCRELLQKRDLAPDAEYYRATTKLGAYLLLDRIGVGHARVHTVLEGIDNLTEEHLRRPVVLKPLEGCSAAGVMVLEPDGKSYYDRLTDRSRSLDEIRLRAGKVALRREISDVWLLEEPFTAGTGVPDDLKFYTFQGDIALILQRRGRPRPDNRGVRASYRWYDAEWNPVETGKHTDKIDDSLEPPTDRKALEEAARRVSTASPYAFTRVDLFATDQGPQVGEVNAWVGGYDHFSEEWDLRLGAAWEAAELRVPTRRRPIPEAVTMGAYPPPWWRR
ncbi:ATP-grasp fold amidoligase family protein [Nocardiopsis sp. LOL_012]|uniref:ATP-grasp fold amidoligase family protein n=1 Tax=Nocardiopsis sp. LOL_012 TaxID=3345409 RepID=UPI003A892857